MLYFVKFRGFLVFLFSFIMLSFFLCYYLAMRHSKITIFYNFSLVCKRLVYLSVIESKLEPHLTSYPKVNNVHIERPLTSTIESPGTDWYRRWPFRTRRTLAPGPANRWSCRTASGGRRWTARSPCCSAGSPLDNAVRFFFLFCVSARMMALACVGDRKTGEIKKKEKTSKLIKK